MTITPRVQRSDPYSSFTFRVVWDGRIVAGVSTVTGLERTTEVVEHRGGSDPSRRHKSPGRTRCQPVTLERGVTHDPQFQRWANTIWSDASAPATGTSLTDVRKDLVVQVYNEAGQLAATYEVFRCWVSEYQSMPDLDGNANAVTIQTMALENEGCQRAVDVTEPTEPTFTEPLG